MGRAFDIRRFATIDSTNTWLMQQARDGAVEGLVAVADEQTAGRGRLGRTWVAPPGASLLMSVLLRPRDLRVDRLHLATAAVALSAADALLEVAGFTPESKWPNDLMVDGRKLAGVLTEVDWADDPAVIVGIGVNCTWPPELPDEIADVAIAANHVTGQAVDRDQILSSLLERLGDRLDRGWDTVAAEYADRCATIGCRVRVELTDSAFVGLARELTNEGHLIVETADGLRTVTAGDVIHLRPEPRGAFPG
ncbi:MAG TPA: biotin--[acetyl-CoA-carboxylase] ligase [Acidimicrobiales bacterium]|nr:biotin--[acetyl-CoA-carboxylase] ligase [Acidimicrobiales bacterium]